MENAYRVALSVNPRQAVVMNKLRRPFLSMLEAQERSRIYPDGEWCGLPVCRLS